MGDRKATKGNKSGTSGLASNVSRKLRRAGFTVLYAAKYHKVDGLFVVARGDEALVTLSYGEFGEEHQPLFRALVDALTVQGYRLRTSVGDDHMFIYVSQKDAS